ncbi:uncharacterized protein P884DRAFT_302145 [Thermothelomyces heterothallicus CBS 202.75]|uniref:uncharacterized protein n=1 Tax=Thermothelomyces heterothallicus CBS 202.75 TaxID=1149848 RepID=UPI0037440E6A
MISALVNLAVLGGVMAVPAPAPVKDLAPRDVAVDDVKFIASYLRSYGAQPRAGRLFNMAALSNYRQLP